MDKKIQTAKLKIPLFFLALLLFVGCTPTKKSVEFEFERSRFTRGTFQGLEYSGIHVTRDERIYYYPFGNFPYTNVRIVNDLDDNQEIDIWLELWDTDRGSQHQVLFYDPDSDTYASTEPLFRGEMELINYQNGDSTRKIFVTRDEDFLDLCNFSVSHHGPIQLFEYKDNRFQDITKEYPQIVEEDAKYWEARIRDVDVSLDEEYTKLTGIQGWTAIGTDISEDTSGVGAVRIASYMADMCLLEKCEEGWDGWELLHNYWAEEGYLDNEVRKRFAEDIKTALETIRGYE